MDKFDLVLDDDIGGEILKNDFTIGNIYEETIKKTSFMDKHGDTNEGTIKQYTKREINDFI